ncbi:MAG: dockerin type I repeat-containing protein, partial [Patescibacteria group bacterium]
MQNNNFFARKVLFTGLILAMLSQFFVSINPVYANILGDIDGNGEVQMYDAALVSQYVAGIIDFTPAQKEAADANGDGKISDLDSHVIADYVVGKVTSLPAHYLQYTREDNTTAEYYAYCDQATDCISSSNTCYNSGTNPWSKYICKSDGSPKVGKWYRCADSSQAGKIVMGYTCQKQTDGSYAWIKGVITKPDLTWNSFDYTGPDSNQNNTILINAYWKNVGQAQANSGYDIKLEIYKNNSLVSNKTFTG